MSTRLTRRQLFRLKFKDLPALARQTARGDSNGDRDDDDSEALFFRPPGAIEDEDRFLATCERCHVCSEACPFDVIDHFSASAGPREGTPFLDPNEAPCRWCQDMPCIRACPTEALAFGPDESVASVGKAVLNLDTCLTTHGTLCDSCVVACPSNVRAIKMIGRQPRLDHDLCTGCGMCVTYCQSQPVSLVIIPPSFSVEAS